MSIQRSKPVVEQVQAAVRQRIRERIYPPGGRMPSESELAAELGVSRASVRSALVRLAAEGLILRKQGDGTYVNERLREVDTRYGGLWDFSRLIKSNGYAAAIETRSLAYRGATQEEAAALNLPVGSEILELVRAFLADGQTAIVATNVMPAFLFPEEKPSRLADGERPIHLFLQQYCAEEIAYVVTDIEATVEQPHFLETVFGRPLDHPLLRLTETFYNKRNRPLITGRSYFDQQLLRLRLVQPWG